MSKGNRKRKPQPAKPATSTTAQTGVVGLPSTINFNEQHLHQHISGDLASTLQVVNQMAPDMRAQAMEMARLEQQHRHQQDEKIIEQNFDLKKAELAANQELGEKHMRNILITDMVGKICAFFVISVLFLAIIYMAVIGNYGGITALACVVAALVAGLNVLARVMGKNSSANKG